MVTTTNVSVFLLFLFFPMPLVLSLSIPIKPVVLLGDVNGIVHQIELDYKELSSDQIALISESVTTTNFTLYTRKNPKDGQLLTLNDTNSVKSSNWNPNKVTVIVTHGWNDNGNSTVCPGVRDAFLNVSDCNVIIYDWSTISNNLVYPTVVKSVPHVARYVSNFVSFLRLEAGLNQSNLKMMGHSLGAHIMGLAAGNVKQYGLVDEVVGFDPAKPLFEYQGPSGRLDRSQARHVQAIHSCAGLWGIDYSIGTSDFFANDGRNQPGCGSDVLGNCAHARSYKYYIESIRNPKGFIGKRSGGLLTAYMGGANLDSKANGTYHFKTRSSSPFATNR
ncbi:pancreatic triacylglycerol lipase [Xylocopa sonorina]|uniref:pancreatic triacylglycerol lipase n=1 Tax=Xylocopa sonorina TaxID=1818115 RepID=UPI00403A9C73